LKISTINSRTFQTYPESVRTLLLADFKNWRNCTNELCFSLWQWRWRYYRHSLFMASVGRLILLVHCSAGSGWKQPS